MEDVVGGAGVVAQDLSASSKGGLSLELDSDLEARSMGQFTRPSQKYFFLIQYSPLGVNNKQAENGLQSRSG